MSLPLPLPQVLLFLKIRNALRIFVIVGFYGCVGLALARWAWAGQPVVHTPGYLALMGVFGLAAVIGGYLLRIGRCPRCGQIFSVRSGAKSRSNFTSQCLNCGLRLDGSNAAEYVSGHS